MMNELFCLNQIYEDIDKIGNNLYWIRYEFIVPVWILAICAIIAVLVWFALGVFSAVTLVKLQHKIKAETVNIQRKESKELIKLMKKKANEKIKEGKVMKVEDLDKL